MRYLRKDSRITLAEPRTKLYLLASFLAPILVLLVIAFKFKLYPFTSDCFATESLRRTYFPVIAELRRKILSGESLFYSWNAGGGVNFWAWISAYASSPFVLLYLLFPEDSIASVTQIIFALKASFAALSLFLLMWKKENVVSPISVALSVAYGLCGHVLTYSQEPWLLDSVILLPLLILTLHFLIRGKKPLLFSLVCALMGITCAKAGVYMLLFVFAMFPLLIIEDRRENRDHRKLRTIFKDFFIYLFLGIGLSAFVWYPACQALWNSKAGMETLHIPEDLQMNLKVWDILEQAGFDSPLMFPFFETQLPSVYCGIFPVILVILYGFSPRIGFVEKVYLFCTMVVLYISMSSKILQYLVLGLHFPITGIYPQALLITFLIMYMSGRILSKGVWFDDRSHVHVALGMILTFMLIRSAITKNLSYSDYSVYMALLFLTIYITVILSSASLQEKKKRAVMVLLASAMILESGLSFYRPIKEKYYHEVLERPVVDKTALDGLRIDPASDTRETKMKRKKTYALDNSVLVKKEDIELPEKYLSVRNSLSAGERVLIPSPSDENYNYGFAYRFATLSSDGYMTSLKFARVLHALGINRSTDGTKILPCPGTPVTDAILRQGRLIEEINEIGSVRPLSDSGRNGFFFVADDVYGDLLTDPSPFVNQNELAYRLTGIRPFQVLDLEATDLENMREKDGAYVAVDGSSAANICFESREALGSDYNTLYIYFSCEQKVTVDVYLRNDENEIPIDLSGRISDGCIRVDLAHPEGWILSVDLQVYSPDDSSLKFYAAVQDQEKMDMFEEKMRSGVWSQGSYEAGKVTGSVDAPEAGTLMFSVPADDGWKATIDGHETVVFPAYRTFLAVHVPEGHHEIVLSYTPEGLDEAAVASVFAAVLLVLLSVSRLLPDKKKRSKTENREEKLMTEEEEQVR